MPSFEPLLHPHAILDFLVHERLPELAKHAAIEQYHKVILDDPDAAISTCRALMSDWVVDMFEAGTLWDADALKHHKVSLDDIPKVPGAYIFVIVLEEGHRFYGGQSKDLRYRTVKCHSSAKHRKHHPSLAYTYVNYAKETFFALPVASMTLTDGPLKNLLEQWLVVVFRCLQIDELEANHSEEAFRLIPEEYLNLGANLAEPFAQGLPLSYFPGRTGRRDFGPALEASNDPVKNEYAVLRRTEISEEKRKRDRFRDGHPFLPPPPLPKRPLPAESEWFTIVDGKVQYPHDPNWPPPPPPTQPGVGRFVRWQWGHNSSDYQFYINNVKIWVPRADVDRLIEDTIRIVVDIVPDGRHQHGCVVWAPKESLEAEDPGLRLGIQLHGTYKGDHYVPDLQCNRWLKIRGEWSIHKANSLVDWMEGLDVSPEHPRPRRWYSTRELQDDDTVGYREWTT
ncbi:hypothetical protein HBI56_033400 [Parastagonospora nodorum]|nr:hypothetical protein HBI10_013220 [Parastagonospora nodorum]KAH4011424.1 hypothetical protein HBI13_197370 [Parastagonospora nodorum]KAH4034655.1 hypothetical protein HBI09_101630 [Parastagonospora nodorum]KAH4343443.1 hypothetical protein HBH98_149910 [Parastagonospora nodorum]KAH4368170.1 hypothetical protein HBH97_154960 [Parastagonospora nodorum]